LRAVAHLLQEMRPFQESGARLHTRRCLEKRPTCSEKRPGSSVKRATYSKLLISCKRCALFKGTGIFGYVQGLFAMWDASQTWLQERPMVAVHPTFRKRPIFINTGFFLSPTSLSKCGMHRNHANTQVSVKNVYVFHHRHTVTHCNTLQHTATHCNTLQIYRSFITDTLRHTATHGSTL